MRSGLYKHCDDIPPVIIFRNWWMYASEVGSKTVLQSYLITGQQEYKIFAPLELISWDGEDDT